MDDELSRRNFYNLNSNLTIFYNILSFISCNTENYILKNFCYEHLVWLYRIIFEKIVCEREWIRKLGLHCRIIKRGHKICREKERKGKEKKENCHPHWTRSLYLSQFLHFCTTPRKSIHTFPLFTIRAKSSQRMREHIFPSLHDRTPPHSCFLVVNLCFLISRSLALTFEL